MPMAGGIFATEVRVEVKEELRLLAESRAQKARKLSSTVEEKLQPRHHIHKRHIPQSHHQFASSARETYPSLLLNPPKPPIST
jgi:hypothetical protein